MTFSTPILHRISTCVIAIMAVAACDRSAAPDVAVGDYDLTTIDGAPIPADDQVAGLSLLRRVNWASIVLSGDGTFVLNFESYLHSIDNSVHTTVGVDARTGRWSRGSGDTLNFVDGNNSPLFVLEHGVDLTIRASANSSLANLKPWDFHKR